MAAATPVSNRHAVECEVCKELVVFATKEQVLTFLHDPVCSDECAERDDIDKRLPHVSFPGFCKVCNVSISFPTSAALQQFCDRGSICSDNCAWPSGLPSQPTRLPHVTPGRKDYSQSTAATTPVSNRHGVECEVCQELIIFSTKEQALAFRETPTNN